MLFFSTHLRNFYYNQVNIGLVPSLWESPANSSTIAEPGTTAISRLNNVQLGLPPSPLADRVSDTTSNILPSAIGPEINLALAQTPAISVESTLPNGNNCIVNPALRSGISRSVLSRASKLSDVAVAILDTSRRSPAPLPPKNGSTSNFIRTDAPGSLEPGWAHCDKAVQTDAGPTLEMTVPALSTRTSCAHVSCVVM